MDENPRIVIRRITRDGRAGASGESVFKAGGGGSRLLTYLFLVPVFIVMAVLGIFFFTAFLALFAVTAGGLAFRIWWLRRKLQKSGQTAEGDYVVIEDAEIVEERVDKTKGRQGQ